MPMRNDGVTMHKDFLNLVVSGSRIFVGRSLYTTFVDKGDKIHLGVSDSPFVPDRLSYVDLQVEIGRPSICYLLDIGIAQHFRGQGLGQQLYEAVEEFAKRSWCDRIEMTCSGWTPGGETRANWVARKLGYTLEGYVAKKQLRGPLEA